MADKLIPNLQLRDEISDDLNFPSDDGSQSYRVTGAQFKDFLLPDGGLSLAKLAASLQSAFVPAGTVLDFAGPPDNIPTGFLYCNGQAVSRTTYSALFARIGVAHGPGDGTTTFNLPDRRGVFVRGLADGSTRDPDRAARTAAVAGANAGDAVGSMQGHAFQTHTHAQSAHNHNNQVRGESGWNIHVSASGSGTNMTVAQKTGANVNWQTGLTSNATPAIANASASGTTAQSSSNETRPLNQATVYMIKY